jgi:hypothetical protein
MIRTPPVPTAQRFDAGSGSGQAPWRGDGEFNGVTIAAGLLADAPSGAGFGDCPGA